MRRPIALLVASVLSLLVTASACSETQTPTAPSDERAESSEPLTCGDEAPVSTPVLVDGAEARMAKNELADFRTTAPATTADVVPTLAAGDVASCPADMVLVEGEYCTNVKQECLEWMDPPNGNLPQHRCKKFAPSVCVGERVHKRFCIDKDEYTPNGESLPQGDTSWTDAKKTCESSGKRLCWESEWQFACEGEEMRPYPYGYERDAAKCNHDQDDLMNKKGELTDHRRPSTELAECTSPFGVRNMTGNIDEWVYKDGSEHQAPMRSALKGGWWLAGRNRCRPATTAHDEFYHGLQTGFRCCGDAR